MAGGARAAAGRVEGGWVAAGMERAGAGWEGGVGETAMGGWGWEAAGCR